MQKKISKESLSLLSLRTVNTVTHSYDTSAVLSRFLMAKDRQNPDCRFQASTIFLRFFLCQMLCSNFGWTESFKQVHKNYFILDYVQISLKILFHFPNILTNS